MAPIQFEYDSGNMNKNVNKHFIINAEAESVFDDSNKIISYDHKHSALEIRYTCIGKSYVGRILYVVFVMRNGKVRIVSARVAKKKNRLQYESQTT